MPVYQTNSAALVAYKAQGAIGSQASGAGASVLRTAGGSGIKLTKASVESNEVRNDGMRARGRHGTQKTVGDYAAELSLGSHDNIIQAIMRGTWGSELVITEADITSITTTTSTIVAASGSWLTLGIRVHDIIRLTNHSSAGNNGRNLRVTGVTATTITVAETLTANAVADTAITITRTGKRIINPASLTKRYFTLEEYESDIDLSTVLTDFVWNSLKFSMQPNGIIMADPGGVGTGRIEALATGASPLFSSPVQSTGSPMSVVDATVRYKGEDLVDLTSLDITIDLSANAPDVFGSGAIKYAPDVFTGQMAIGLNMTMLRKDLAILSDFIGETPLSLHLLAVDNESEPKDFFSIAVPNFTLGSADPSALSKEGGGRTQTLSVPTGLVGKDDTGGAYDATMIKFQTSAA